MILQTTATTLGEPSVVARVFFFLFLATTLGITWWAARRTPLNFLYVRPSGFRLVPGRRPSLQPAE